MAERGLPDRSLVAMFDASMGFRVRNATYRASFADTEDPITDGTASRDLRQLVDAGLLLKNGAKRGTFYTRGPELEALAKAIRDARDPRDESDPFASAA